MNPLSAEGVGITLLTVAEVPNFYSGLLPSLFTIGHFGEQESEEARYWIRRGEIWASALTVTMGLAGSILAKSILPFIGCAIMASILLYLYEDALVNGSGHSLSDNIPEIQ
jgi:hypothetical protein